MPRQGPLDTIGIPGPVVALIRKYIGLASSRGVKNAVLARPWVHVVCKKWSLRGQRII